MRDVAKALISLLASLFAGTAIGFAGYTVGAVIWSASDPLGAGRSLLFTIPIGIAGTTLFAVLALFSLVNRDLLRRTRPAQPRVAKPAHAIPPRAPAKRARPPTSHGIEELEVALAS